MDRLKLQQERGARGFASEVIIQVLFFNDSPLCLCPYVRLRDCYGHQVICTITKPLTGHGVDTHSGQYTGYLNESERLSGVQE